MNQGSVKGTHHKKCKEEDGLKSLKKVKRKRKMKSQLGINVNSAWEILDSIFARPTNERTTHGHIQDLQVKGHLM